MGRIRKRKAQEALIAAPAAKKQYKESRPTPSIPVPTPKTAQKQFIEDPRGLELKREVELYERLSSPDVSERLEAADAVVSGLLGGDGVSEAVLTRHLERRLFRGLASGRKAARLGFSVVVTEVLARIFVNREPLVNMQYPGLGFEKVLEILKVKTKPEGDLSGQEERDHAFGLLFGLQCFVRAEVLFVGEEENSPDRWEMVFDNLLQLARKKPWMREECGYVIVEALGQMDQNQAEGTVKKLQEAGLAASPEGVGIWITARRRFHRMRFPTKPWGQNGNPLEHLSALAKALKESSNAADKEAGEGTQQSGNWHHQLHFAWDIVLHECAASTTSKLHDSPSSYFSEFWQVAVDESLFSSSASPERKFWGFLVFQRALRDVAYCYPWILSDLFSQNFMRCLINHVSHKDRFLHRAADKCIKSLLQQVEAIPEILATVIPRLINGHGVYNFDQVTKTKTIERLLSLVAGDDGHKSIIDQIFAPIKIIKTGDSTGDAEGRRQMFGDYLLSMIRRINILDDRKDNTWIESHALPLLASIAYCKEEGFIPPISEKTRTVFRNRLNSALTYLISDSNAFSYPYGLLQKFNPTSVDMDDEITSKKDEALAIMQKLMKKAKKAREDDKKTFQALAMLYALVIFQLYNGESDAISLLDELKTCYGKLTPSVASDVEASVVLIEILLSFMSKQSALLRKVAQQAFTAFSNAVTEESLKLLVDVLDSSENLKGQQDLFDQDDDDLHDKDDDGDDDDDDNDEEEDELDSDVEILGTNGIRARDNSTGEEQDDEEDDDEESDDEEVEEKEDEDDAEVRKLEEALAKALGTHRADVDPEKNISDSDSEMTDSEMMALDSKLVEIFSQRKKEPNKKQEKKNARENIINFKSRVLDLLEIFVKEQAGNSLAFDLLVPLLKFMRTTTAKSLHEKAHKVITYFAKASKAIKPSTTTNDDDGNDDSDDSQQKKKPQPLDRSHRLQVLQAIHSEAASTESRSSPSHAFTKAASTASLLVATTLYRASTDNARAIDEIYHGTQARWHAHTHTRGDVKARKGKKKGGGKRGEGKGGVGGIQVSFFQDWLNWCQSHLA